MLGGLYRGARGAPSLRRPLICRIDIFARKRGADIVVRCFAARRRGFQLDALPFAVAPADAQAKFDKWAKDEQGLGPLLSIGSTKLSAAYTPFWYFDVNVRFVDPRSPYSRGLATPEPFISAFPNPPNGIIHVPGLAAYAGFSYRRSLVDPVHNTTPVFMRKEIVPFGQWMLEPLKYGKETLEIYPDPWNATRERAFSVVHDELHSMANDEYSDEKVVRVETERLSARRIYMPTYVVEYTVLGATYRAYISGCDPSVSVSGISHTTAFSAGSKGGQVFEDASSFLSSLPQKVAPVAASTLQFFGLRPFIALTQLGINVVARVAMKIPILGALGAAFVTWRKIARPYMEERTASAEWERQRDHEAQTADVFHEDAFRDSGSAKAYFNRNQRRILHVLSGEEGRRDATDGTEWYKQWEQWAREQWEQAQREAGRAQEEWQRQQQQQQQQGRTYKQYEQTSQRQQQRQQRQQQQTYKQQKKETFKWPFDENDPWSVLGIPRNSSKEEVSKAFRREMLKHHPDLQSKASDEEKRRATERSKIISDAYRKIKATFKK